MKRPPPPRRATRQTSEKIPSHALLAAHRIRSGHLPRRFIARRCSEAGTAAVADVLFGQNRTKKPFLSNVRSAASRAAPFVSTIALARPDGNHVGRHLCGLAAACAERQRQRPHFGAGELAQDAALPPVLRL